MSDDLVKVDNVSNAFYPNLKLFYLYGLQGLGSEIGGRRHGGGGSFFALNPPRAPALERCR